LTREIEEADSPVEFLLPRGDPAEAIITAWTTWFSASDVAIRKFKLN
jgi:hypothetical protein